MQLWTVLFMRPTLQANDAILCFITWHMIYMTDSESDIFQNVYKYTHP